MSIKSVSLSSVPSIEIPQNPARLPTDDILADQGIEGHILSHETDVTVGYASFSKSESDDGEKILWEKGTVIGEYDQIMRPKLNVAVGVSNSDCSDCDDGDSDCYEGDIGFWEVGLQQKLANKINVEAVGKIDSQRQENVFGGIHLQGQLATNDIENGKDSIGVSTKIVD
jgi:hypothetical protein